MKFVSLLSSGIDSPVATHLMLRAGHEALLLHMDGGRFYPPEENEKARMLADKLSSIHPKKVRLFRSPHEISLSSFSDNANRKYTCLLCKKSMMKVADGLCDMEGASFIVMGDSLGQVASQTLLNLAAVSAGIGHHIIRPLIGFDKIEIERIAREIGTYEISSRDIGSCKAAPRYPITKAEPARLEEEAEKGGLSTSSEKVLEGTEEVTLGRHR